MNFIVTNIIWAHDDWGVATFMLPEEVYVSWENGCMTKEEAIDFVSEANDNRMIEHCEVFED
jgi:hypothetical protein